MGSATHRFINVFSFFDAHIEDYFTLGYTVFRQILPPTLVTDLRRSCERALELARETRGPQAQRLQPVGHFDLDQQPFVDYAELSELRDAVERVLTPRHSYGDGSQLGVLFEPAELPYCTAWHRDWRDNARLELAKWDAGFSDINLFNQSNCALYEDSCTWVVPGSHLRRDLPREAGRFPERPIETPELEGMTSLEREYACLGYVASLPGGVQLHLQTGDFALYRNTLWHVGNYVPYRKRATLHDMVDTPEFSEWRATVKAEGDRRREAGLPMENPNRSPVG